MGEGAVNTFAPPVGDTSAGVNSIDEGHKMNAVQTIGSVVLAFVGAYGVAKLIGKRQPAKIGLIVAAAFAAMLALAGCSGDGNTSLRATAAALNGNALPVQSTPQPPVQVPAVVQTVLVEATRIVPDVRTVVQTVVVPVEVPVEVPVVVTATPDIQGFPAPDAAGYAMPGSVIDESVQPCPVPFWKNGRCTATQAQMDAYALEGGD